MSKKVPLVACWLAASAAVASAAACLSDQPASSSLDGGADGTTGSSGSSSSGSGSGHEGGDTGGVVRDGAVSDADAEGGALGLLVDNMTAMKGTQVSLQVPAGQTPGSYYAYSDYPVSNNLAMMSFVTGTSQLADIPVSPPITNVDGSQIVGELCFGGSVVNYAGLGMSLAYGNPPDATPESGLSSPVPFDASHYSGVTFYILADPSDGPSPSIRFSIPDTQTADPAADPTAACSLVDSGGCDDDFGADVTVTPGSWTKVSLKWADLGQVGFGMAFTTGIKRDQLIGMKWQVNGSGVEASSESFKFCISDIYFTP
jgi:hypothetical protein